MPGLILAVVLGLRLHDPEPLQAFRLKLFDVFSQLAPRAGAPAPVAIVEIDEESLRRFGQWPWPRTLVADLLGRLFAGGARVVAFNIVFAEPDRTAPRQVLPYWFGERGPGTREGPMRGRELAAAILEAVPDHDRALAAAVREGRPREGTGGGVVVGVVLRPDGSDCPAAGPSPAASAPDSGESDPEAPVSATPADGGEPGGSRRAAGRGETAPDGGGCLPAVKASYAKVGDDPLPFLPAFGGATGNLPGIEAGAAGVGSFNLAAEPDGIVRRVPLLVRVGDRIYPSLAPEAVRVFLDAPTYDVKSAGTGRFGDASGLESIRIGDRIVPVDAQGRLWLHFAADRPERRIPAWRVLAGDFEAGRVAGRVVFVGTSAPGLASLRMTPPGREATGTEIHAEVAEQILRGDFIHPWGWHAGFDFLLILLVGGAIVLAGPRFGALPGAAAALALLAALSGASWYLFAERSVLFDPVYAGIAVLAVFMGTTVVSWLRSEGERAWVRKAFDQYLSPALVEQLAREPERLRLGGDMRTMTMLFCDIRDFTSISESYKADPAALVRLVNRFLNPLTDVILAHRGTIDKYMGDCIMACWNAPIDDPEHARHACDAAIAMSAALEGLNTELAGEADAGEREPLRLQAGIGINTGECVVGNMGSDQRFDYSVMGDSVNLASRLEGLSVRYGVDIVVGEETNAAVEDTHATLELDLVAVKGKSEAVRVFALLGGEEVHARPAFQSLRAANRAMIDAYRARQWGRALALLRKTREFASGPGELYDLYEMRIHHYLRIPPPPDWDGVFVVTNK